MSIASKINAAAAIAKQAQVQSQGQGQAPSQGMWKGPGSLQHSPGSVGPARGPPLGLGLSSRISPAAAGLEDQRSPQRRKSGDPAAEGVSVSFFRWVGEGGGGLVLPRGIQ